MNFAKFLRTPFFTEHLRCLLLKVGEVSLYLKCEDGNEDNKYSVAVMIGRNSGGYAPKNLSNIYNLFFLFLTVPSNLKSLENVLIKVLEWTRNSGQTIFIDRKKLWIGQGKA